MIISRPARARVCGFPSFTTGRRKPVAVGASLFLALLAALVTINNFTQHISPDTSIYLLHARSFLETGSRYAVSHDSKGPVLVLLYAPFVFVFGATMAAAAALQLVLHGFFTALLYRFLLRRTSRLVAGLIALLAYVAISAPSFWGGNMRAEDALLPLIILMFLSAERTTPAWRWLAGGIIALAAGMKISMLLPFGILGITICVSAARHASSGMRRVFPVVMTGMAQMAGGFVAIVIVLLGVVLARDSLAQTVQQILLWPLSYRTSPTFGASPVHPLAVIWHTRLWPLLLFAVLAVTMQIRGNWVRVLPAAAFLLAEMLRISLEGTRWNYLAIPMLPVLIIAVTEVHRRSASPGTSPSWSHPAWLLPLLAPIVLPQIPEEMQAMKYRLVEGRRAPYEELAARVRGVYAPGQTIYIDSNDYQLLLLLDAPRPWPVLPLHFTFVSIEEQRSFRQHHTVHQPDWIITRDTSASRGRAVMLGAIDGSYHVYVGGRGPSREGERATAEALLPTVGLTGDYRCIVDLRWVQAWRKAS